MTKVIGKREVLRVLNKVVKAEGTDRTAVCYYTQGGRVWEDESYISNITGHPLHDEDDALAPECIVGQVVAALGGDMAQLSCITDTWEAIVKGGNVVSIFRDADVHLTEGANAILAVAQNVQDGRADTNEAYGFRNPPAEYTWGEALRIVTEEYKHINKVVGRTF